MNCPYCGKEVLATDGFCEHCDGYIGAQTRKVNGETPSAPVPPVPPKPQTPPLKAGEIRCGNCKQVIPKSSILCPHCGKMPNLESVAPITNGNRMEGFKGALWGVIIGNLSAVFMELMSGLIEEFGVRRKILTYLGFFSMLSLGCGVASLVLGVRSIKIFKNAFAECKPVATLVLGIISLVMGIVITAVSALILFAVINI